MPLYRALNNLSDGTKRWALTRLTHLNAEQIGKLERVGAISRVAAPPLSVLPGWKLRAGKLAKVGIADAEMFIEAPPTVITRALRVKAETATRYQQEIEQFLVIHEEQQDHA